MSVKHLSIILSLFLVIQAFSACSGDGAVSNANSNASAANTAANNSRSVNDNAEELGMLVVLPAQPEEVAWREEGGGKLIAVMRFGPADANRIGDEASKIRAAVTGSIDAEDWFPKELVAQSELAEDSKLKGQEFAGDMMLQPPYIRGRLLRIETTDFYILEAFKQ